MAHNRRLLSFIVSTAVKINLYGKFPSYITNLEGLIVVADILVLSIFYLYATRWTKYRGKEKWRFEISMRRTRRAGRPESPSVSRTIYNKPWNRLSYYRAVGLATFRIVRICQGPTTRTVVGWETRLRIEVDFPLKDTNRSNDSCWILNRSP